MIDKANGRRQKRKCDNCGKAGVIEKRITRIYGRGKNALVIENVPVMNGVPALRRKLFGSESFA